MNASIVSAKKVCGRTTPFQRAALLILAFCIFPALVGAQEERDYSSQPWFKDFVEQETRLGKKMAQAYPWLRSNKIRLMRDPAVGEDVALQTQKSLEAGLAEVKAEKFRVVCDASPFPAFLGACIKDYILDFPCFEEGVKKLRKARPQYAEEILIFLTEAAIETSPGEMLNLFP